MTAWWLTSPHVLQANSLVCLCKCRDLSLCYDLCCESRDFGCNTLLRGSIVRIVPYIIWLLLGIDFLCSFFTGNPVVRVDRRDECSSKGYSPEPHAQDLWIFYEIMKLSSFILRFCPISALVHVLKSPPQLSLAGWPPLPCYTTVEEGSAFRLHKSNEVYLNISLHWETHFWCFLNCLLRGGRTPSAE